MRSYLYLVPRSRRSTAQDEDSAVASIGHAIEPVIKPLGLDSKVGVGLITCVAARETIIATLGTLNGLDAESQGLDLQSALRHELSPAAALALLVFFAYAMQCMATLAVIRRKPIHGSGQRRSSLT